MTATQAVAAAITRALTGREAAAAETSRLIRVEAALPDTAPLDWLRAQTGVTQYYWADRDGDFEMAGVGEADVLAPFNGTDTASLCRHIRSQIAPEYPGLRYYGGFRFHRGAVKGERWRAFKEYRFVVPRFEVLRRKSGTFLCCNARTSHPKTNEQTLERILKDLAALRFPASPPPIYLPAVSRRTDAPDQQGWNALLKETLNEIGAGRLEKAVLARETCFEAETPWDAASLLSRLAQYTAPSFEFCFHPAPDRAFIGASPERLFKRVNCYVQSEALAGTRPRGKTDEADFQLGRDLMDSAKERREHAYVLKMLQENLTPFCRKLEVDKEPSLMRLRNVQHLWTRIEGILDDVRADAALLETLHPTPAVGGVPRAAALKWIEAEEPFDRGIFAAPVGWIGYDASEFCVAIRSGLVQGNTLALYSGAGIVAGSVPDEEWAEIETKMANFVEAITQNAL